MGIRFRSALKTAAAIAVSVAALYAGRVAGLYLLSRFFRAVNLTADTYAQAPSWMRYPADHADQICACIAYAAGITAVLFLRDLFPVRPTAAVRRFLLLFPAALCAGWGCVRLLIGLDEIRELSGGAVFDAAEGILTALYAVFCGQLLCRCICAGLQGTRMIAVGACVAVSALLSCLRAGAFGPMTAINGALFGALAAEIRFTQNKAWPAALLQAGFLLGARVLGGYPGANIYYVSDNLWSGGAAGMNGSAVTAILLAALCAVRFFYSEVRHGKKAAVHRESAGR